MKIDLTDLLESLSIHMKETREMRDRSVARTVAYYTGLMERKADDDSPYLARRNDDEAFGCALEAMSEHHRLQTLRLILNMIQQQVGRQVQEGS